MATLNPQFVTGGPNDSFKRFEDGLCLLYPCPGRMLLYGMETKEGQCPAWVMEEAVKAGGSPVEMITVTTYKYRCVECGYEAESTELISAALKN